MDEEASGRDTAIVRRAMAGLAQSGAFAIDENSHQRMTALFASGACDEAETAATIKRLLDETGILIDPHTAVGVAVAKRQAAGGTPMITLATAHPAKFPEAVQAASGAHPELPEWTGDLMDREEVYSVLPADLAAIEQAIEERSRAVHPA